MTSKTELHLASEKTLTPNEREFLSKLASGKCLLREPKPRPAVQSLIDRGYCRTSPERLGPLGIYTGETCIFLTEAGHTLLFQSYRETKT